MKAEYLLKGNVLLSKVESDSFSHVNEAYSLAANFQLLRCDGRYDVRWSSLGKSRISFLRVRGSSSRWTLFRSGAALVAVPVELERDFLDLFSHTPSAISALGKKQFGLDPWELPFDDWVVDYLQQEKMPRTVVFTGRDIDFETKLWVRWEMSTLRSTAPPCRSTLFIDKRSGRKGVKLYYRSSTKPHCLIP
ncbi:hypothetical protein [Flaviaesturariibacter terrae]